MDGQRERETGRDIHTEELTEIDIGWKTDGEIGQIDRQ